MKNLIDAPICQSCSMPIVEKDDFGTNSSGDISEEYCTYCFQDGKFTDPVITKDQMVDRVTDFLMQTEKRSYDEVRFAVDQRIRQLRRWSS